MTEESHQPPENPYVGPDIGDQAQPVQKPVPLITMILLALLSVFLGGVTFFFTCLGMVMVSLGPGGPPAFLEQLLFPLCFLAAFLAMGGSYWFFLRRARRRRAVTPAEPPSSNASA